VIKSNEKTVSIINSARLDLAEECVVIIIIIIIIQTINIKTDKQNNNNIKYTYI